MTKEELQGIKNEIKNVGAKISGNFWVCFWLFWIVCVLEKVIDRLDILIGLAK